MTHYYYYYHHFYYCFGCLKVPSSSQQAFLSQWVSPEIDACLCGKVGIASGPRKGTSDIDLPVHERQLVWAEMCGCSWLPITSQLRAI